jgi:hypothetical protein
MESVARQTISFRLPRYAGAILLSLISAGCLALSYIHEGWFGRLFRIAVGLALPWIAAWLVPLKRGYRSRLAIAYISVIAAGVIVVMIWPFFELVLMDAGVI